MTIRAVVFVARAACALASVACVTSQATTLAPGGPALSPLTVADRLSDSIAFFGVDFGRAAAKSDHVRPSEAATWTRLERDSGATVLRRAGYLTKTESAVTRPESYTGARLAIAGDVVELSVASLGGTSGDPARVDVRIEWRLFDATTRTVIARATADGHADVSGDVSAAVAAGTTATLSEFLENSSVKASLPSPARPVISGWRRATPVSTEPIVINARDANVDARGSLLEGALSAVASLRGSAGVGSAFVLSKDGLAITNYHVVHNQHSLTARFLDGRTASVRVLRTDAMADLALLEIACPTDCYTIDLSPGLPALGEDVYAIGSPVSEQFSHSVTKGIVSGVRQRGAERLLQTDAALNRGNSGGPLVEVRTARAVGIVSQKLLIEGVEGIGFAIALDDALRVLGVHREGAP